MKQKATGCAACGHSKTQHSGGEGCWGGTFADCGCQAMTVLRAVPEEVDRYGVLDREPDLEAKAEGQERALRAVETPWKERFASEVRRLAASGRGFTSEDVIARVGLPTGGVETNANNAVGAMMSALARSGVIRKTGQRVLSTRSTSHGAELTEWVGE